MTALSSIQGLLAEKAAWGGTEWTVMGLGTAAATTATLAGNTNNAGVKVQHLLDHLTLSVSGAITVASTVQVKDGTTVIWECQWGIGAPLVLDFDFLLRPLPTTPGALLSASTSGTQGAALVCEISMTGRDCVPNSPA